MSKKMMKRTAALSALIAISLSGTVMAAEAPAGWTENSGWYVADQATNADGTIGAGTYTGDFVGAIALEDQVRAIGGKVMVGQGVDITGDVYGGYKNQTTILKPSEYNKAGVDSCSVTIDGGTVTGNVYGGYKEGGSENNSYPVDNCSVTILSGTVDGNVYGANTNGNRTPRANTVTISGGTINGDVYAGKGNNTSYNGTVKVSGGTVNGDIYANKGNNMNVKNGTVELTGGTINGDVYASYTDSEFWGAKDNKITVGGDVDVSNASLYGSNIDKAATDTLNISEGWQGEIGSVAGFDTINIGNDAKAAFAFDESKRNTTMTINGGTWQVTGDSDVSVLEGDGANIQVDMTEDGTIAQVAISTNNASNTEVSGTGNVADYLAMNGDAAVAEFAVSVSDKNGAIDDTLTTEEGIIGGAYTITQNADGTINATQADNSKSDAVSNAGMNLKAHFRAHMNDMNKRMGELRMANGEAGVWARMVRGEYEYQGAKSQHNQYQFGYDKKLAGDDRWTVSAALTISEGDGGYSQGYTEEDSKSIALYGSKLNKDGSFVDLIARYIRMDSDVTDSVYGSGDYDTNGYSFSAEVGKRIEQNGFWVEPQAELTYGTIRSTSMILGNQYRANFDSMDSLIARLGFSLGKDIKQGNVYARASYLYDFDGESTTTFVGGKTIAEDLGGGWWEVGVGANVKLSDATYVYADVEKTFGGEIDANWQWNLGVRYSF